MAEELERSPVLVICGGGHKMLGLRVVAGYSVTYCRFRGARGLARWCTATPASVDLPAGDEVLINVDDWDDYWKLVDASGGRIGGDGGT